ncbi:MAG: DUF4402 domain-containing protein [Planctomycetota bacterium]
MPYDESAVYFYVGATLNLSANQSAGVYTGQFTVTVNFQ